MYFACSTKLHSEFFYYFSLSVHVVHDSLVRGPPFVLFFEGKRGRPVCLKVGRCATATSLLVYSGLTISSVWSDEHER
jgi:hypothetical protein